MIFTHGVFRGIIEAVRLSERSHKPPCVMQSSLSNSELNRNPSTCAFIAMILLATLPAHAADKEALDEHAVIGVNESKAIASHNQHPDAQWYPDAGFGLFIHWGIHTAGELNDVSWPMIVGSKWREKRIADPAERERIVRERDYNKEEHPLITPNDYWKLAEKFNPSPETYDPGKWIVAAKEAGFTYAVLVTQHHEGFSMWPSDADDFNTKKHMGGRDLVKPFVEACRKHGLKVGLYYSPPNWHFDRDYMNFLYYRVAKQNPEFPELDADLLPRTKFPSAEEKATHQKAYAAVVRGQVEELLTRYGKIDLLWFDGRVDDDKKQVAISADRIRELQPGIVMNPRLHGKGDFRTYENELKKRDPYSPEWAEFCHDWTYVWAYNPRAKFRDNAFIIGELVMSRASACNYLLSIGPDKNGELPVEAYANMAVVAQWMKTHGESIRQTKPLPRGETVSTYGTAAGNNRYVFHVPAYNKYSWKGPFVSDRAPKQEVTLTLSGSAPVKAVTLLGDGLPLAYQQDGNRLVITLPVNRQGGLVDVVKVELTN